MRYTISKISDVFLMELYTSLILEIVYLIEKNENLFQTKITIKDYQLKTPFSDAANPLMVSFIAFDRVKKITFNLKHFKIFTHCLHKQTNTKVGI